MTLDKFLDTYKVGKSYDYANTGYKGECVSLVKCYIKDVLGVTPQAIGNAKDYWLNRNNRYIADNFTPIANTLTFVPQRGDLFVRTSGTYGHIGIVLEATKSHYYTIEQNYNGCRVVKNIKHTDWSNVNFLRPKNQKNINKVTPEFEIAETYTLSTNVKVRVDAGTNSTQKKKSQLTADGQKNALNQTMAVLKAGTKVTVQAIKQIGSDVWVQIPSGWICVYYQGELFVK